MMSRLRKLNRRQAAVLAAAALLGLAVLGSALTGHFGLALTLLGVFLAGTVAGLLFILHRLAQLFVMQRTHQRDVRHVLDHIQRRLLGAVEEMLLTAGDRRRELTETLAAQ